jgi:hypothetical protein
MTTAYASAEWNRTRIRRSCDEVRFAARLCPPLVQVNTKETRSCEIERSSGSSYRFLNSSIPVHAILDFGSAFSHQGLSMRQELETLAQFTVTAGRRVLPLGLLR